MARVLHQPQTRDAIKAGIDTLAGAVIPTLGPLTGPVALDDANRKGSPELLDDGGVIARRILQLDDRDADIGAMLLREALWEQRQSCGDGTATAAVLYQTVFNEGRRFISAGGDAMLLRQHLEAGIQIMLAALQEQAHEISSPAEIERLALSVCGDREIARTLMDIFDVLSPHSPIDVRDGGRDLRHEFFLGSFWESKVPSGIVFEGVAGERIELKNTAWLISDFELDDLGALVALVTCLYEAGYDSLAIVAKSFSEQVIAAQGANKQMDDFTLVYIEPTGLVDEQEAALEDLALITGGQVLRTITGHSPGAVTPDMLGASELAWLDRERFGIIAGAGDEETVQREIAALERRFALSGDSRQQELLRSRIGRLRGGSAVVYAHGSSESEMRYQKGLIQRAIAAIRSALLGGVLPGGGAALLRCIDRLRENYGAGSDPQERAAGQILIGAATAPCRQLLSNAGHEAPGIVVDKILSGENGASYDLRADDNAAVRAEEGVIDSAAAVMTAVRNGIGGAALALTVDTIVHRVNPPLAIEPGGLPSSTDIGNIELK
ncbi:MAG: hypothetical protein OXI40_02780 [Chloroflexota bacterium]|nr:hypothetical protein [Chloroflexota bacterium]